MYKTFKRIIDVVLSGAGILFLSPLLLLISLWIKFDSPGPILFTQKRIGIHKRIFTIYKFRSMRINAPMNTPTHLLGDPSLFITSSGAFLRRTSLDELPQLLNILLGEMSIIGPRPALWNQFDLIAERDKYGANDILPGLTGWAQINGRDELEISIKAKMDGEYVKKMSFSFDFKIFLTTVIKVFQKDGVREGKWKDRT